MKNLKLKLLSLGLLTTLLIPSMPIFASTNTSTKNINNSTKIVKTLSIKANSYWGVGPHIWDIVGQGGSISYGYCGQATIEVQIHLRAAGYNIDDDGIFGSATRAAVIDYQSKHGLSPDGIVGPKTWASLEPNWP